MATIFISYGSGDEYLVQQLADTLSRLQNVNPYVAEWVQLAGVNLDQKVKQGLNSSRCVIALITLNSQASQWANQEIGYAVARGLTIIPIKEEGVTLKGFLEGKEYIKLDRSNFGNNLYLIITRLRQMLTGLLDLPVINFRLECQHCQNQFWQNIPSQQEINDAIRKQGEFVFICNRCSSTLYVSPFDLSVVSTRQP